MERGHQTPEKSDQIRTIQFVAEGKQTQVPAPLIRVTTCGLLTIETVQEIVSTDPPLARYASLTPEQQRGRGTAPALLLLKLLVSRPERYALRDWLMEQFCQDRELFADARLDNLAWLLRKLICPPGYDELRTQLVAHVQSASGSGNGYQLAPYPLIWVDSEALAWNVEQAVRMERFGDDPLSLWERAYELAKRGMYLPDELYSDWAESRRGEVTGMLRQSVLALARLYQERHGTVGEEEALLVLRSYWQEHPREEDALRPLMELLGRRECYQEALEYYERLCRLLEEDNVEPDPRTKDIAEYVRTKQIQRPVRPITSSVQAEKYLPAGPVLLVSNFSPLLLAVKPEEQRLFSSGEHEPPFPVHTGIALGLEEPTIWFGEKLAHLLTIAEDYYGQPTSCLELQETIGKELDRMQPKTGDERYTLSRRQLLFTLATLPPALLLTMLQGRGSSGRTEQLLTRCAASLAACWHLMRGSDYTVVEELLPTYLPLLANLAQEFSKYQSIAASLATQGYRLKGILALHRHDVKALHAAFHQAVYYAEIAQTPGPLVAALISLAYHTADPVEAEQLYRKALIYEQAIPPLQRSRLYAELAVACAQQNREDDAMQYLNLAQQEYPARPESDPSFLYAEFSPSSLILEKGRMYLALTQHQPHGQHSQHAWETFASVEAGPSRLAISERIRYEIVNYQAETAVVLQDRDLCCEYVEKGAQGAITLGSIKRQREVIAIRSKALKLWPHDERVKKLKYLFA